MGKKRIAENVLYFKIGGITGIFKLYGKNRLSRIVTNTAFRKHLRFSGFAPNSECTKIGTIRRRKK